VTNITVRPATPDDASTILTFIRGLAEFEHEPLTSVKVTEADIIRDGFGPTPRFESLIAELEGAPVGFALFFPNYSTWEGVAGIYIEDLFVLDVARGHGVGRALMAHIAALAKQRGAARVELSVLDWNPARAFYERLGMSHQTEWLPYRLTAEAIETLAREASDN